MTSTTVIPNTTTLLIRKQYTCARSKLKRKKQYDKLKPPPKIEAFEIVKFLEKKWYRTSTKAFTIETFSQLQLL